MLTKFFSDYPDQHCPVTFDNWYTQPAFCQFLDKTVHAADVGTLANDDQVILASGAQRLDAFALKLQAEHQDALTHGTTPVFHKITIDYKGEHETYYSYCHTHRIHHFGKQRVVINHRKADLADPATFLMSNKLNWQAQGITRLRRHRWPVEVDHEEGKADGLDQYQVRDFQAKIPLGLSRWSPSPIACCEQPNTIMPSFTPFHSRSRQDLMALRFVPTPHPSAGSVGLGDFHRHCAVSGADTGRGDATIYRGRLLLTNSMVASQSHRCTHLASSGQVDGGGLSSPCSKDSDETSESLVSTRLGPNPTLMTPAAK